jgi:hypothetical protein
MSRTCTFVSELLNIQLVVETWNRPSIWCASDRAWWKESAIPTCTSVSLPCRHLHSVNRQYTTALPSGMRDVRDEWFRSHSRYDRRMKSVRAKQRGLSVSKLLGDKTVRYSCPRYVWTTVWNLLFLSWSVTLVTVSEYQRNGILHYFEPCKRLIANPCTVFGWCHAIRIFFKCRSAWDSEISICQHKAVFFKERSAEYR